ncbi:hypothetical protein B0H34DRAFT_660643 [Crassisporium funariophilum]|nr:hypothetical protein B0H34DRAFT_660643 [Crassisporium funariophilum]
MSKPTARNRTPSEPPRTAGPFTRQSNISFDKTLEEDTDNTFTDHYEARKYLESKRLLVPEGQNVTTNMAASCLYQIANAASNTPKPVVKAIRALAVLLEESETGIATQTYHDGFQAELDNFTSEIQQLIAHAHEKIDEKIESISLKTTTQPQQQPNGSQNNRQGPPPHGTAATYSQMLTSTQPDVDPRMLAKYGIRRRQVMLDGIPKESELGQLSDKELASKINTALQITQAGDGVRIRAATKQSKGGILIEMDSDYGAAWTKGAGNMARLCKRLNDKATVRPRLYQLIAFKAPLSAEPEEKQFITEVEEANGLPEGTITAMRWAKPIYRRSQKQISAHVLFTVNDANEANRLLALGLYIANKKVEVQKCKIEPIRCLKCQGWNHFARECNEKEDTCGTCAVTGHRTNECSNSFIGCVSCKTDDHTSYDRQCPTLLRKQEEKDRNIPENSMPFIQTDSPWTWNKSNSKNPPQAARNAGPPPEIIERAGTQKQRRAQANKAPGDWQPQPLPPLDQLLSAHSQTSGTASTNPTEEATRDSLTAPRTQDSADVAQ